MAVHLSHPFSKGACLLLVGLAFPAPARAGLLGKGTAKNKLVAKSGDVRLVAHQLHVPRPVGDTAVEHAAHDPIVAQDCVDSWRRILTPSLGAEYAYFLYLLRGAEAFNKGLDADFSHVRAAARDAPLLRHLGGFLIVVARKRGPSSP